MLYSLRLCMPENVCLCTWRITWRVHNPWIYFPSDLLRCWSSVFWHWEEAWRNLIFLSLYGLLTIWLSMWDFLYPWCFITSVGYILTLKSLYQFFLECICPLWLVGSSHLCFKKVLFNFIFENNLYLIPCILLLQKCICAFRNAKNPIGLL